MSGWSVRTLILLATIVVAGACASQLSDGDSETHFLTPCVGSCGAGLSCINAVCTRSCSNDAACASLHPAASCVTGGSDAGAERVCDVRCASHAECAGLGAVSACLAGRCRGPSGAAAPDGGRPDATVEAAGGGRPLPDATAPGSDATPSTPDATAPVPDASACCTTHTVRWHRLAGPGHSIMPCRRYTRENGDGGCSSPMADCDRSGPSAADLEAALGHQDVVAARAQAPVVYGAANPVADPTPQQTIDVDGATITILSPCVEGDCSEVPEGVAALYYLLKRIEQHQATSGQCDVTRCREPVVRGSCETENSGFAYNPSTHACEPAAFGDCVDNPNRFDTLLDCEAICGTRACGMGIPALSLDQFIGANCSTWVDSFNCFDSRAVACACACQGVTSDRGVCQVLPSIPEQVACTVMDPTDAP